MPAIQTLSASPEQHRTVSTQAYVLTSNDGTLSPASIGSLAALPGVTTAAAPTPPEGSTWPSANPLVNLAVGPLQFDPKFSRSPVLASPFTIVNAPFQLLTGQSIVNPNGTTSAPTVQNLINAETTALGLLAGVPAAYVANTIAVVQAIAQNPGSLLPSGLSVPAVTTLSAANTTAVSPTTKTLASTAVTASAPTASATPTAPAGSTWPSTNPVVNLLVGPLQFNSKWQSPVLASPFTIVNAPFQLLTGQSIVNPDGTTVAPTVQNFIAAETKAFGLLVGLPGAYVANTIAVVTALSQNPGSILPSGLIQPTATTTANPTVAKTAALSLPESPTTATSTTTKTLASAAVTASAPTASATPTAPAGSTWPSTNPVVNLLVGPLQFNSKWQSPVLASPFTIVNAPFQLLTGQSIVNPDGTTSAPTIQNLINAEAKAFGLLVGLPGAYVSNTIAVVTALTQNPASLLPAGLSAPAATTTATGVKAPTSILSALSKTSTTAAQTATTEQKTAAEGTKSAESKATTSKSSPEAEPAKAGAAKPANPAEAVTPAKSAEPAKSATPAEQVKPAEPAKPATPADAATPAEPAKPATAADAAAKPVDAAKPAEPKVNVPKVKLPTPVTKLGEVSGGVAPKTDDSTKADKSEKTDSKTDKADKGSTPKKPEKDSSPAKKPEAAASSSTKSESGSSSSSSDSHAGSSSGSSSSGSSSSGSSHSDSHKAS
ncbi:hypothetical protein [Mycobacteroides abscessus]